MRVDIIDQCSLTIVPHWEASATKLFVCSLQGMSHTTLVGSPIPTGNGFAAGMVTVKNVLFLVVCGAWM